ncbi:MAG: hypothetical protein ACJAYE_001609 [Candidatus Azotimanducaceae bacterium]|jgi:hypothetical protein
MPYEIIYQNSKGVLITNYSGVLTDEEFRECAAKKFSQREITKSYLYSISDLTALTGFDVSTEALKLNAFESKKVLSENVSGFMVVVASDGFMFGMGRLWAAHAEGNSDRVHVFKTRKEADAWIEQKLAGVAGLEGTLIP